MENQTTLEQLVAQMREENINGLREIARRYHIVPKNMKRSQLESEIMAVFLGNKEPSPRKKAGRPTVKSALGLKPNTLCDNAGGIDNEIIPAKNPVETKDCIVEGTLEVLGDGYGFLRGDSAVADVYVPPVQIKRFNLKSGDKVKGNARYFPPRNTPSIIYVMAINDVATSENRKRVPFDSLIACNPDSVIKLETTRNEFALRIVDLVAPIGKGQRGLIVAPPKTGKTILLKKIAQAVRVNHPKMHLTVVLIDERPEEVTDFQESVDCEVMYSTFDQSPRNHIKVAETAITNAKRRVEVGQDVIILLDSITRLARAYNQVAEGSGRTLTGGLDISALQEPKKLFGAGRNVKGGGSITILATALIDTGSKMDDIIYEEFKGTGNMELHLDRKMSERRVFPAIDLHRSGTRREDLLLNQDELEGAYNIRRALSSGDSVKATEKLIELITMTNDNSEFLSTLKLLAKKGKK